MDGNGLYPESMGILNYKSRKPLNRDLIEGESVGEPVLSWNIELC